MFETTLASKTFSSLLRLAKEKNYEINLIYMWLGTPELAVRRVAMRVKKGGHFIPEDVIRRRFERGIRNLKEIYMSLADDCKIYDNAIMGSPIIMHMTKGNILVYDVTKWKKIQEV